MPRHCGREDREEPAAPEHQDIRPDRRGGALGATVDGAIESISYGIPAFKYKGKPLIYLGAAKNHCALYAINTDAHKDMLKGYETSKGTVRFSPSKPLPEPLVRKLVKARINAIEASTGGYGKKSKLE